MLELESEHFFSGEVFLRLNSDIKKLTYSGPSVERKKGLIEDRGSCHLTLRRPLRPGNTFRPKTDLFFDWTTWHVLSKRDRESDKDSLRCSQGLEDLSVQEQKMTLQAP